MTIDPRLFSPTLLERMAHDIRGPLGVMAFILDELENGTLPEPALPTLIRRGRRSLSRLINVADRLSRVATIEAELSLERTELRSFLRTCIDNAHGREDRGEIVLACELDGEPCFADIDRRCLAEAFGDLLFVFIMRARTTVTIGIDPLARGVQISLGHDGKQTQSEPDLFSDLPIALFAATVRRHGWAIEDGPPLPDPTGLLNGRQLLIRIRASA